MIGNESSPFELFEDKVIDSVNDCVVAHPTRSTAAIVVISMCFISLQLSILHPTCRHVFYNFWIAVIELSKLGQKLSLV